MLYQTVKSAASISHLHWMLEHAASFAAWLALPTAVGCAPGVFVLRAGLEMEYLGSINFGEHEHKVCPAALLRVLW
jgi:hypothetical protein